MVIQVDIIQTLKNSTLEQMFQIDFMQQPWVWVNKEIFPDIISNVIDYNIEQEEAVFDKVRNIEEGKIINLIKEKMNEKGWIEVNQKIFEKLEEGFRVTKDIQTYIFVERKYYSRKLITKMKEMEWLLKAMAVDTYQHLTLEIGNLTEVFKEKFNDNSRIIEEILLKNEYELNEGVWRYNKKNNLLEFYKNGKNFRQWAEGNADFTFYELSR